MIRRISWVLLGSLCACVAFAREEYTRTFDKTLTLQSGQRVFVENKFGDVTIRAHAQPDIVIHALIHVSANDMNQAKSYADRVEILIEPASSEISIRTRYPDTKAGLFNFHNVSYSVRYDIAMPEVAPLELRNAFGAVMVTGVKASCQITNSHGDLEFRDGHGTHRLENSFASVRVHNNSGDVTVDNTNGSVDAGDINGALSIRDRFAGITVGHIAKDVTIINNNGSVVLEDCGGPSNIKNSFGSVTVHNVRGDLTVNDSNGAVEAAHVDGAAELNTSFGQVLFSNIGHQLSVRANNSKVEGQRVGGPLTIQNSFGSVTLTDVGEVRVQSQNSGVLISNARGAAEVKTSFGKVEASDIAGVLSVRNQNGSVKAAHTRGAQVTTSFGAVLLEAIDGPLEVENQNGSVDASANTHRQCQPVIIHTSFSPIHVRLPNDASYRVTAKTSYAKIRSDFPLTVSGGLSSDDLAGTIGGGACEMRLTNNNGEIQILRAGF